MKQSCHMIERPPSTASVAPVMNDASSLASQRIGQAISCGVAQRPSSDVVWRSVLSISTLLPAALDAGLGRVVEAHALAAGQRIARRDVDDTGAAAAAQRRERRLAVVGGANEIDADDGLPLGGG